MLELIRNRAANQGFAFRCSRLQPAYQGQRGVFSPAHRGHDRRSYPPF
jgi:hypothetical protein